MDVAESDADGNLNEKEGEVSSTCNDSLPASVPSNSLIETGTDCVAPSCLIQEEIIHSDSPDTSGETRVRSEAEQSELSDDTEHVATVQSVDATTINQENPHGVDAEVLQNLPDESIELLHISEDSEIVLLDENVVISTTSEPTTFIMPYENQEEMQGAEMSTTSNTGFQLEIPESLNVLSAKASDSDEAGDVLSNKTRMCPWNPDSTTVEIAEESNDKNENISFTEQEVSTTEEDVGNIISTSNVVKPVGASGENTSFPSTTKAKFVSGTHTQDVVQDMQTSQSHIEGSILIETAPQNSGISTTSMKDTSWRKSRWDQVKSVMETSATEQAGPDCQGSDPQRQILNILSQPSTSKQESHVNIPEQSVYTSKNTKENNSLPNQVQDCVSSSKDVDIVTELPAPTNICTEHQESDIDTTTKVHAEPQLYSALDLIKSNYCSPFDDDIPSPGSSTHEEQKHIHNSTKEAGECIIGNTSLNEKNSGNELKGNVKIDASSPGLSKERKERREVLTLENTSATAGHNLHQPSAFVEKADTMLSTVSTRTAVKYHATQQTSLAKQIVTSCGESSVHSRTNLLDVKEIISSNKNNSVLVAAEEHSNVGRRLVAEVTARQKDSSFVADISTIKQESFSVTEASTGIESSCVAKLPTGKEPLSDKTESLFSTEELLVVTKSAISQGKSSVQVETSTRTEPVDDTEAPVSGQECSILSEIPTRKESKKQVKEKDPFFSIETSVKGTESTLLVTEVQKVKERPGDGRKLSTEEKKTSVHSTESYAAGKETSVADQMPVKEKMTSHCTTLTPVKEEDSSSVDKKVTTMWMEEASENKHPFVEVKDSLAIDEEIQGIVKETSATDLNITQRKTEISVRQTKIKENDSSPINIQVEETAVASRSGEESLSSDAQETLAINKQLPDKEANSEIVHEPSAKMGIICSETQVLIEEEGIDVVKKIISTEREDTSNTSPQLLEKDSDILGLQEHVKEKPTSSALGRHISPTPVQLLVLKEETNIAGTCTQKKNVSLGSPKTLEENCESVMDVPEVNTVTGDQMLPRNMDKDIIRKRLTKVIGKQKIPTESHSCGPGIPSMKTQTVTDREFPVLAEDSTAAMKEITKKAISRMPEKSHLETMAPEHSLTADKISPSEAEVALTKEPALSPSTVLSTESNKQTTDMSVTEGLAKMTKCTAVEENLTSVTTKPSLSHLSARTEDSLYRICTSATKDSNLKEISVCVKEAILKAETSTKQAISKPDSISTENLVLSKDTDKEEKFPRKNLAVEHNTGSSTKETQKLIESSGTVSNEGLKSSVLPATKRRVKLIRPVLSRSKEMNKPEYSLSLAPAEVTKLEPLSLIKFKNTAKEVALSKTPDSFHSVSSTGQVKTPAREHKEENLQNKAVLKAYEQPEFETVVESREIKHLDISTKILAKNVDNPNVSCTSKTVEVLKTSDLLEDNKPSGFSASSFPGESTQLELPSKGFDKSNNLSAEAKQSDLPIGVLLTDVKGPEFPNTALVESTEMYGLSGRGTSKEYSSSFSAKESFPAAASQDILKSKLTSKEITQLEAANVEHSETSQSTFPASLKSEGVKHSILKNVTKPERGKCLEQPGLLLHQDYGMPEKAESSSVPKLEDDIKDKHVLSESVKKPKLIQCTMSGSDINKTKVALEETIPKEGLQAIVLKQQTEEGSLCIGPSTEVCTEKKDHGKTFPSTKTKMFVDPDYSATLVSSSKDAGNEKTAETGTPSIRSDKERCQLNVSRKENGRKSLQDIVATTDTETSETAIPHSTNFENPKGEFVSAAQIRESKQDIFHNDKINMGYADSSSNESEQKGELITVQSQCKIEYEKIDTDNVSSFTNTAKVSGEAYSSNQVENTAGSTSAQAGTSSSSSEMLKKAAFDVKSVLKHGNSKSTGKITLRIDTQTPKQDDNVLKPKLVEVIAVENITLDEDSKADLVEGNLHLEESKDKYHEEKLDGFSTENKSEILVNTSKTGAPKTMDIEETNSTIESKSDKNMKQDKIILKITKGITPFKGSSSVSAVKELQPESNLWNSESISKEATSNTMAGSKPETYLESRVLSPDSSAVSKEHVKVEKLTLKLNKDPGSDSFTKDGTSSRSSWTSTVSTEIGCEAVISPKHENINMKLKKDPSSMAFKATSFADNSEVLHKTENTEEGARVEKRTLKLKKDISKAEDIQKERVEEPKLEKITLKFKKDPAHPDIIVATTSMVLSNPGEVITTRSSGIEQVETVVSSTLQDESKPQKITLKLKKDGTKQEAITVTSKDVVHQDATVPVRSTEIKLPETEDVSADKVAQRLKKDGSKSEALVLPSKESINQETTVIPIKLKDGKIQEKPISPDSKDKPAREKLTLKLRKDGTTAATSKEECDPETTVTRVKAPEVKQSNENTSLGSRIEPFFEKITLKLKKDSTKPETTVYPETTVTQVKATEELKPEADASLSPKEDPLVAKITLKLKKEVAKPETVITSKIPSIHETTVIPTKITDMKQKQSEANVSSSTKDSTIVEKIMLKIKKDPTKQEVTPVTPKQGQTKLTKGGTSVQQEEPKIEKLTLKLKKDAVKSAVVCGKEVEPSKQPDIVTKLDTAAKEENKVEKLTLKLKKDSMTSEIITGKKIVEQESGLADIQNPEQSVVVSSKEEVKVEKLTLKLKRADHSEGDLEVSSTQTEEEKFADTAGTSVTKEGKVEKLTLKIWKDLSKSEEPVFATPKDIVDTHAASDHQISGDQEVKLLDETSSEGGKPKKIMLTLKKDSAWSVKRKIRSADCGNSSGQTSIDESNKLGTEDHFAEFHPKRAKIEELGAFEKSEGHVTSSMETVVEISKVFKELSPEPEKSESSMEVRDKSDTEEKHLKRIQKDFKRREALESRRPEEECPDKRIKLELEMKSDSKSELEVSKTQSKESLLQHDQEVSSSHISHSKMDHKRVNQGETVVEGRLREILSKMVPRTSTILSGDLSIRFAPFKTPSNEKLSEVSHVSVTSSRAEMMEVNVSDSTGSADVQVYDSNVMQQSTNDSKHCGEVAREESGSKDVMIMKEENQPSSSVQQNAGKMLDVEMVVPDYHAENVITEKSLEVKPETETVKTQPKKGRGRPRKTAVVPSVIPVIEPPPELVVRPKRMCRGRERPPVVVKVRKPRTGKGE